MFQKNASISVFEKNVSILPFVKKNNNNSNASAAGIEPATSGIQILHLCHLAKWNYDSMFIFQLKITKVTKKYFLHYNEAHSAVKLQFFNQMKQIIFCEYKQSLIAKIN
jgi:hypothetical protein